ncbi:MAG: hypothetical protein HYU66_23650, partial [Armatimonadetes bacterium]|nr:hypothetical protein [Armatimonadota bacterium]
MRRFALLAALLAAAAHAEQLAVFLQIGLTDTAPTPWRGSLSVDAGQVLRSESWLFSKEDGLDGDGAWHLTTDPLPPLQGKPRTQPNGLLVTLNAPAAASLLLTANGRQWSLPLADLTWGAQPKGLDGAVSAQRAPVYTRLQDLPREDDYPAAAALPGGDVVAVWQSWSQADNQEQLFFARLQRGVWGPASPLPGAAGDLYRLAVTGDGQGGFLVAWSGFADGDYDLFSARLTPAGWQAPVRLTRPGNDSDVALATAADGTVYAVWRAYRGASADILGARWRDGKWSEPFVVDGSPANEWAPAIAAGPAGVWAAWDSYRNGSYDVFAARVDQADPTILPVATSPRFEARATVACGPGGEVWFAWQEGAENWGKDTGPTVPKAQQGARLYAPRAVKVACLRDGRWLDAPDPFTPQGEDVRLSVDGAGRLWLVHRRALPMPRQAGERVWQETSWESWVASLEGNAWSAARRCAARMGRQDSRPALAPLPDGVALVFHTDGREQPDLRRMSRNRIFGTTLTAAGTPAAAVLTPRAAQVETP